MDPITEAPKENVRKPIGELDSEDIFEVYRFRGKFRTSVIGGIPADPEILEGHMLRKGKTAQEIETALAMLEKTVELNTVEGATAVSTNVFYGDEKGIFINDYQIIGMLKEVMQIQKSITSWRNKIQNGVRVSPQNIYLMREGDYIETWDGFSQSVVHSEYMGRPQSSVKKMAYINNAEFECEVWVGRDFSKAGGGKPIINAEIMRKLLKHAQEIGLGAMRRMGNGKFDAEWVD